MDASLQPSMRRRLRAALLLLATACTTAPASIRLDAAGYAGGAILHVRNTDFDDVTVVLVRSGTPIRLGAVPGLSSRVFTLAGAQVGDGGELQLLARTRSNPNAQRSAAFMASVGQRIAWVVNTRQPSDVVVLR